MTAAVREDVVVEGREGQWPVEKLPPNRQIPIGKQSSLPV
jgi:hypothetical protein